MTICLLNAVDFNVPELNLAPPLGVTAFEFQEGLWRKKTRVPRLSCGVIAVILCLAIFTQYRRGTDGQTDGQIDTRRQHIGYRASIASHAKNYWFTHVSP